MSQKIARIRIELAHLEPTIWRRVEVSLTTNLRALHEIIQAVMPWESYHLYDFRIGDRVYGEPDPEDALWGRKIYQTRSMRLGMLVDRGVAEFLYTYDFGDDWQHRILIEEVTDAAPGTDYPVFVDGERTAPPEDVGGPPGFMGFVEAMAKPRHPQHRDMVRWYGGPFNPVDFGAEHIAANLRTIALKRKAALEAFERGRNKRLH
ncbi:plasmid pRiA4b ORF-3 family protein [Ruegeria pomeroyi]|uniref:Plasmid pRiA4b ORF-3 family protein n=1 Tax=Ruegeria pomeroyi TaxID=89184 RepID=A0A9Q3WQA6_9RHOB|nr:plasmid pRiA4b ORF-3 family protein [Ruegeria pomeroyi]MCE8540266.1 plasmid pRiA4b ORF-3 family protein [Ruegeria pomeroyi]